MADTTTNPTVPSRSIAMDFRMLGKLWNYTKAGNEEIRRFMWMGVFLILGGYALACFFHYQGWFFMNLLLSVVAAMTLFVYGFQPLTIGTAVLGGLGYAAAKDEVKWPEGMGIAVEALGRLVAATIFFSVATFGFYGTYPFDVMSGAGGYLALLVAAIAAVSLIVYRKIDTGSWLQTISGFYIAAVVIVVLLGGIPLVRETVTVISSGAARVAGYESAPTPLTSEQQEDAIKAEPSNLELGKMAFTLMPGHVTPEIKFGGGTRVCYNADQEILPGLLVEIYSGDHWEPWTPEAKGSRYRVTNPNQAEADISFTRYNANTPFPC